MIILVTGGRDFKDYQLVAAALDKLNAVYPITGVVHGAARGADYLAADWAFNEFIPDHPCPKDFHSTPFVRNSAMLMGGYISRPGVFVPRPEYCVAFPGGNGTADMVCKATDAGLTIYQPYGATYEPNK